MDSSVKTMIRLTNILSHLFSSHVPDDPEDESSFDGIIDVGAPNNGEPPKPIAAGVFPAAGKGTTRMIQLVQEMDNYLRDSIRTPLVEVHLSIREICTLPKTPDKVIAIPPRNLWPNMAYTIENVWMPLRKSMGIPLAVRAYRPPDYNKAVGGSKGSRHQYFQAMDIRVSDEKNTLMNRLRLVGKACELYMQVGALHKIGLGVYGPKNSPTHIHIDAGYQQRHWGCAAYHIKLNQKRQRAS